MPIPVPLLLLAGVGVLLLGKKRVKCPEGTSGGVLSDIRYKEIVTGGADANDELPMVIVFHGRISSPEIMMPIMSTFKEPARIILPEGFFEQGGNHSWWKKRAKDPDQEHLAVTMAAGVYLVEDFIKEIARCRPTIGKPFVAGHSQGGSMVYAIATLTPNIIAGAFPASGWLPESLWSPKTAPILAVHGRGDTAVPFAPTADYVEKMHQLGAKQIFLREVNAGHVLSGELLFRHFDTIKRGLRG